MKKIEIGITQPVLNSGETLLSITYRAGQTRDFNAPYVIDTTYPGITGLNTSFQYDFDNGILYLKIVLLIERANGTTYLLEVSRGVINGRTREVSNLVSVYPANPKVRIGTTTSLKQGTVTVDIPAPKFYIGSSQHLKTIFKIYDIDYNFLYSIEKTDNLLSATIDNIILKDRTAILVEAEYVFLDAVYQPKGRTFIQLSERDVCNFTLEKGFLSPTINNYVKIIYFYGDVSKVKYYVIDPDTDEIITANLDSSLTVSIPADLIVAYKEVLVRVFCKSITFGNESGEFRLKVKE